MRYGTGPVRLAAAAMVVVALFAAAYALWYRTRPPQPEGPVSLVRVGVYDNAPKVHVDDNGEPAGLFVALIREIARAEGWRLEFVACEWQTCLERLAGGGIDLMPDVAFSLERSRRFEFHQIPVAHSWSVVVAPAEVRVHSLRGLNQRRVALLAGAVQVERFDALMDGLGVEFVPVQYPNYATAFAAVRDGRADAVVTNSYFAAHYAHRYGLRETPIVFNPAALYFAAAQGDPRRLLAPIDTHLRAWRFDDGSVYYDALRAAMVPAREIAVPPALRNVLAAAGALVLLLAIMSAVLRWQVRARTAKLSETAHRLDHMLESSPVVLYQLALDGSSVATRWVSDNVRRLFGFDPARFVSENLWQRQLPPDDRHVVLSNLAVLPQRGHLVQEYRVLDATGGTRIVRDEMQYTPGAAGQPGEIVGSWNDLTESRAQAERVSFLTHYDPLTGLPNRALFGERLAQAAYRARREGGSLALLCADVDRFKAINDSLGHGYGDAALKGVARRLAEVAASDGVVARIGDDSFALLLESNAGRRRALATARAISEAFSEPIDCGDQSVSLTLSVGISTQPEDGDNADALLQHAESALADAKRSGRNVHRLYSAELSAWSAERLSFEIALRGAAARGELELHFQPQVDLAAGTLLGVEALVRWRHPELGLVAPGRFIPVAEEMGIVGELGAWVLEHACAQLAAWDAAGVPVPRVAVNLSVQQIDGETLLPLARRVLGATGLDPARLELEVTESIIMREPERSAAAFHALRRLGIRLAIDDFGIGYSSLNYLKHLPIDRLKIDQSFVRDIGVDASSELITRAIIGLARSLELDVLAEGIEHEHQLAFLRREGCRSGQGYLFSPPVPAHDLAASVRSLKLA